MKKSHWILLLIGVLALAGSGFLLQRFWLVKGAFAKEAEIKVQIPKPQPSIQPVVTTSTLTIIINHEGKYSLSAGNKQPISTARYSALTVEQLKYAITSQTNSNKNFAITILAHSRAPHQSFARLMDVLRQLGYKKVSIVTFSKKK